VARRCHEGGGGKRHYAVIITRCQGQKAIFEFFQLSGIAQNHCLLFEGSLDELRQNALQAGFAADNKISVANLEDMFLSKELAV
jgi:hypothetical protein